jgi:hypothetical protein
MRSCEILMRRRIKSIANCGRPFEYRHMIYPNGLIAFLTLGFTRKYEYPENTEGDQDYWPYYRKSDFEYDLARPMYLFGAGT